VARQPGITAGPISHYLKDQLADLTVCCLVLDLWILSTGR